MLLKVRAFVAELESLHIEAFDDFAVVAPAFWRQSLTTLTTHFLRRTFERACQSFAVCSSVSICPVYSTRSTIEPTSSYKVSIDQDQPTNLSEPCPFHVVYSRALKSLDGSLAAVVPRLHVPAMASTLLFSIFRDFIQRISKHLLGGRGSSRWWMGVCSCATKTTA